MGHNPGDRRSTGFGALAGRGQGNSVRVSMQEAAIRTETSAGVTELPPGARRLGENALDPHHAFAVGAAAWGVQFHPEFDAAVMRAYLIARREILRGEGIDPGPLEQRVTESPQGFALLRRFADFAGLRV